MPPPVIDQSPPAPGTLAPATLTPRTRAPRTLSPKTLSPNTRAPAPLAERAASNPRQPVGGKFNLLDFARQTLKSPTSIGAIAPSSKYVADSVISLANIGSAKTVVELGPGTGVFTEQIVNNLSADSTFFALELNEVFVQATKDRCPQAEVYHDTALSIGEYLHRHDIDQCDCIVSSLPWTIFEPADQDRLLQTLSSVLAPGGCLVSIVYLGANTRRRGRHFIQSLPAHFNTVYKTKTVWQNMPPTQIYRCGN